MFCVGVWELTAVIRIETKSNTYALIFSVILLLVTFLRVSNIMAGLLFVICCLPFYCLPEWCPCHQWLTKDDLSEEILNKLEEHQWIYQEAYMIDKTQKVTCIICLDKLKQGDLVWFLPCPPLISHRGANALGGSVYSEAFGSSKESLYS